MPMTLVQKYRDWERGSTLPATIDLTNPDHRRRAMTHYNWADHAILRRRWTNFFEIAPGVYRSNQPTHERFERYAAMGIKTVINLRGASPGRPHYLLERESCAALGIRMIDIGLHARAAPPRDNMLDLIETFRDIERPFMMHCKSGADRAGLASAVYKLVIEGAPLAEAKAMLSFKYLHIKWHTTGILDYFLDVYEARLKHGPIAFETWLRDEYDEEALTAGYRNGRKVPQ
ncbi:fused DSP-PTPase phosphatase/NAD kinase-like protein [Thalassovita sp.]|uniref:fused DSP-PTPase phosphatase/NAD kinase-like protein n=1 Tax=Thalassovita sp. TaxID=1979401 RepID=UPI002B26B10A|nr:protein tyrosine phosphatase [Thalassovita sp.]